MKDTIILIEDDVDLRENTVAILESANYNVLRANKDKEGINLIKTYPSDLILCDVQPKLEGYGILRIIENIQGTGLGLVIVKKYVELMNGNIEFISKHGEGTTFTIEFPQNNKT